MDDLLDDPSSKHAQFVVHRRVLQRFHGCYFAEQYRLLLVFLYRYYKDTGVSIKSCAKEDVCDRSLTKQISIMLL